MGILIRLTADNAASCSLHCSDNDGISTLITSPCGNSCDRKKSEIACLTE